MMEFDDVVIDVQNHQVRKSGEPLELEPKSLRVLVHLVENRGRVVPKEELFTAVWNGSAVTDNALTRVIAQLRKALGDDAKQARYIETVPTVGYRFIGELKANLEEPVPEYVPRKINWFIPIGAISAVVLAYFMPVLREWTRPVQPGVPRIMQFTVSNGLDTNPVFSPDGSSMVYSSDKSGHFELYVKQVASGGAEIRITKDGNENVQPAWSPDGSSIAYTSVKAGGIHVVSALGGMPRRLTDWGSQPAWSADSKTIVFRSEGLLSMASPEIVPVTPSTLWTVPAGGGSPRQLTKPNVPEGRHSEPSYSPDGQHLVFVSFKSFREPRLVEMDLRTGEFLVLTSEAAPINPTYSRDGAALYFVGYRTPDAVFIFRMPIDPKTRRAGAPVEVWRADPAFVRSVSFTPDGRRFAYSVHTMSSNLWQRDNSGAVSPLTNENTFRTTQPVFSPDGSKIAYLSRRKGVMGDIWVMDANGENQIQITREPGPDYMPSWLPDGKSVVYASARDGQSRMMRFSLADGSEKVFAPIDGLKSGGRLSPDAREVVLDIAENQVLNTWKIDVATAKRTQLTFEKTPTGFSSWSPDGKWLALETREHDNTHLVVVSSSGGPLKRLTNRPGHAWPFSWSPDGKQIAIAALWDGVWNLYTVSLETQEINQLTNFNQFRVFVRYPAWSPKGDPIVFERNETRGNIFLAELPPAS